MSEVCLVIFVVCPGMPGYARLHPYPLGVYCAKTDFGGYVGGMFGHVGGMFGYVGGMSGYA
jgi:hypothetical protein